MRLCEAISRLERNRAERSGHAWPHARRVQFTHPRTGKPETIVVSQRLIASVVFQALYSPEISALLPRLLTDAAAGHYQGLFALAFSRDLPKGAMSDGMFLSVVCAEDLPRMTADDIARESSGRFIGQTMFETQLKPCAFWPRGTVTDDYYAPVTSNRPTLIFSGANDPVTPPSWGDHVAEHLPHAKHFVVPGAGHITLMRGCVPELVGVVSRHRFRGSPRWELSDLPESSAVLHHLHGTRPSVIVIQDSASASAPSTPFAG